MDALRAPAAPAAPQAAPEPRRNGGQSNKAAGAAPDGQDYALGGLGSPTPRAASPGAARGAPAAAAQGVSAQGEAGREADGAAALAARLAVLEDALGGLGAAQAAAHGHVSGALHAITARLAALQARRPGVPGLCLTCRFTGERLPGLCASVLVGQRAPWTRSARMWSRASAEALAGRAPAARAGAWHAAKSRGV